MSRNLFTKLVMIMVLIIVSLVMVIGAFLMRGIRDFYHAEFRLRMQSMFTSNLEFVEDLRAAAADEEQGVEMLSARLRAWAGPLGIDSATRNYYILDSDTCAFLGGSDIEGGENLHMTPNLMSALAGNYGMVSDSGAQYMDIALRIESGEASYIIYIRDSKDTVSGLIERIVEIFLPSALIGIAITVLLSMLLAKTMVTPIQSLTRAAERVKNGDFSSKPESLAQDEIGVLTNTFNDMALQLETTLLDLQRSESMRREFVANVSHELRTPITSIKSYAETLVESEDLPPETNRDFLGVIVNESDRMSKIVGDLLTLSRFDVGSFEFVFERFSFKKSVRDVYNAMQMEAQRRNQSFTLELDENLPDIPGDRARIEQVLMNMISNALKYTHKGGKIEISAGCGKGEVWASVRDNGVGIPPEDVPRVFERFYRVDKARSRESGGTGLGLSIAQEIITRHRGAIELESEPGRGTVIRITLPTEGGDYA